MIKFKTSKGKIIEFEDTPLSQGGEGAVYKQYDSLGCGDIGDLAKTFHDGKADGKEEKIKAMLSLPAPVPSSNFAWPKELLYDITTGDFCGYVMYMKYNKEELGKISSCDSIYRKTKNWLFYLSVAKSLAQTVAGLHKIDQVVGDLNDKNVLVDMETAQVTLIDNDSFHITVDKETFRCCVGMGEYIAPEIQDINFREAAMPTFTKHTDNFSLAVLIFKLLMNGLHPFNSAIIDEKSIEENVKNGKSPFFLNENKNKSIPPWAPPIEIIPAKLNKMFKRAFNDCVNSPHKRPSAQEFYDELDNLVKDNSLQTCNRKHQFPKVMNACPWCFVDEKMRSLKTGALSEELTFNSFSKAYKKSVSRTQINSKPNQKNSNDSAKISETGLYNDLSRNQRSQSVSNSNQIVNDTQVVNAAPVVNTNPVASADPVSKPSENPNTKVNSNFSVISTTNTNSSVAVHIDTMPPVITNKSKVLYILGMILISILTISIGFATLLFQKHLLAFFAGIIIAIIARINLPNFKSSYTYQKIVEFPSYITKKIKTNEPVQYQYVVVSKYKLAMFNILILSVKFLLGISLLAGATVDVMWIFISFSILSLFNAFYVTENRTLWSKTLLGIIMGIGSILTIIVSVVLFILLILLVIVK